MGRIAHAGENCLLLVVQPRHGYITAALFSN